MPFNAPLFLFAFLPVFFGVYLLLPLVWRNRWALLASLAFYGWAEPRFLVLVVGSGLIDWALARRIHQTEEERTKVWCVRLAVATNLVLLAWFKYAGFFVGSLDHVVQTLGFNPIPIPEIALPIGISFVVFQKITYVVDVRRGDGPPARSFADYLLYVTLFPQLIAGPIVKYHDVAEQLRERTLGFVEFRDGLLRFSWGLVKKVLLADALARLVGVAFAQAGALDGPSAWLGVIAYAMQIYLDFSAYSDMAIGLALMMGFHLRENFNRPYISRNFTEFWRRWHISLSTWIRDYLYLPLGGNRKGRLRTYLNLWLCFFLSGLWHGASWAFVVWGLYHGLFMALDKLFWLDLQKRLPNLVNVALTFVLVLFSWVLFRAEDFTVARDYLAAMWGMGGSISLHGDVEFWLCLALALVGSFAPLVVLPARWREGLLTRPCAIDWRLAAAAIGLLLVFGRVATDSFSPFIYFRF